MQSGKRYSCLLASIIAAGTIAGRWAEPRAYAQTFAPQTAPAIEKLQDPKERAPFELTVDESAALSKVLEEWEIKSNEIGAAKSTFTLRIDDPIFEKKLQQSGYIKYQSPDRGVYIVMGADGQPTDHLVCDGDAIYDLDHSARRVTQFAIPGGTLREITFPPFAFLFGSNKVSLTERFWMRLIPVPDDKVDEQIWIEAQPRKVANHASFVRARIILQRQDFLPHAIEMQFETDAQSVIEFLSCEVMERDKVPRDFLGNVDLKTTAPPGWTKTKYPGASNASDTQSDLGRSDRSR